MSDNNNEKKLIIEVMKDASYKVSNLPKLLNSKGEGMPIKETI